ncbi:MAG: signal peptidase I [Bacteriovoracaceae bacterium]
MDRDPNDLGEAQEAMTKTQKIIKEAASLIGLIFLVLVFRSVFFEPFRIPSGSMIPTLMIGDFILVKKFEYGFKVPFSDVAIGKINSDPVYLFGESTPKRGDVVVFKYPKDPAINFIKRVVGLPGDTIEVRDKVVYVNDTPIDMKDIDGKEIMADMDDKFKDYNFRFFQSQTGDASHVVQVDTDNSILSNSDPIQVPSGHYFVMGDNRDFSSDSRVWGFVPHRNIKGKAIMVWFSMIFFPLSDLKFRPHRIGNMID